jgi:acyl carrier protein phosphodiesterase
MNYLAHAYLSFGDPGISVGNLISDFVKGRRKFDFPSRIQQGMQLHRDIDSFTDKHPATIEAKQIFRADYRLYSSAFVDVVYDHFLASDPEIFTDVGLKAFTSDIYLHIETHQDILPEGFASMFPYMKTQDWLYNYRHRWGLEKSFGGLVRRATYLTESETAFRLFEDNHEMLRVCYLAFIPDMRSYAERRFQEIIAEQI